MTDDFDRYDDDRRDDFDGDYDRQRRRGWDYEGRRGRPGYSDSDWADDIDERDSGSRRGRTGRRPVREPQERPRRREREYYGDDYGREDDYDRKYYENDDDMDERKPRGGSFVKRHPVLMNFVYIIVTGFVLVMMLLWFLDFWTFHGQERVVPDVKGQPYAAAVSNVDVAGLRAEISDSVFDSYSRPGTVVEQTPIPGAKIKKGGTVYLTVVAFSPKLITVPDFYNVSVRQARSMFEGLGIKEVREQTVTSEYQGLVLGAKFNGVSLQPGARIPVSAVVTLEVGSGFDELEETGADVDTLAIDAAIEELNIE